MKQSLVFNFGHRRGDFDMTTRFYKGLLANDFDGVGNGVLGRSALKRLAVYLEIQFADSGCLREEVACWRSGPFVSQADCGAL